MIKVSFINVITILYEDDDIVAADKPVGMASIPESAGDENCLQASLGRQLGAKLLAIHRLDKDTSGVIIFAKTAVSHAFLNDQFSKRLVKKEYAALLHGKIPQNSGSIRKPIREFGSGRMGVDSRKGKHSTTHFEVVNRYPESTLVRAFPETGRRHQLRVHFYSIGHAILGDPRYGDKLIQTKYPRLMLHAKNIKLTLPSGKPISLESPLPPEFSTLPPA